MMVCIVLGANVAMGIALEFPYGGQQNHKKREALLY